MHKDTDLTLPNHRSYPTRADRSGEREVPAGEGFTDRHHVGADVVVLAGEKRSGAAEAGGDLIVDQQQVVLVAEAADGAQVLRIIKMHAAGALDHGLADEGGAVGRVVGKGGFELVDVSGIKVSQETGWWPFHEVMDR